ncbi:MAG: hypothetical protein A2133_06810 [Actinobacteria bacterium RBG_16_64_13]|nr:MAG: hypothetical protein A2133_06810 [Actinobacteria bacterium RBG_16_64_13]
MIAATKSTRIPKLPKPELENVDPLTARVFHALGKVIHLNRLVMLQTIAQRGVQFPEAMTLSLLCRHDGVSQRELADILHLSRPRVSMILRNLETSGAILRRVDETDRRVARVFLTDEGRKREREQRVIMGQYVDRTIGALPEADRRELERLLGDLADRVVAVLREGREGAPPDEEPHCP